MIIEIIKIALPPVIVAVASAIFIFFAKSFFKNFNKRLDKHEREQKETNKEFRGKFDAIRDRDEEKHLSMKDKNYDQNGELLKLKSKVTKNSDEIKLHAREIETIKSDIKSIRKEMKSGFANNIEAFNGVQESNRELAKLYSEGLSVMKTSSGIIQDASKLILDKVIKE
jgi:uncharacterized membrane protein YhiD involved in acid resistance